MSGLILVEKLYKKYKRFSDISDTIGEDNIIRLQKGILVTFYTVCQKIDPESIGYTYEDFLQDYNEDIKIFQEKKIVYNIWKQGYSINAYGVLKNLHSGTLLNALKKGLTLRNKVINANISDVIDFEFDKKLIEKFEIIVHDDYCKLLGNENDLNFFKEKYNITYPVLSYKNLFHIAFDGCIFKKIKELK
jgi:hypothetical protein